MFCLETSGGTFAFLNPSFIKFKRESGNPPTKAQVRGLHCEVNEGARLNTYCIWR